jgi:hypothetical protein
MKKFLAIIMVICLMASLLVACDNKNATDDTSKTEPTTKPTEAPTDAPVDADEAKYLEAFDMLEQKNYEGAYALFTELGDYKDAAKEAAKFRYVLASYNETYTDEEGTITYTGVHSFNEDNLIQHSVYTYADGGTHTCDCSYNDKGELAKIVCTDEDGTRTHYECLFNDDGTVAKVTYRYSDGYCYSFENVYDENGKRIKINYESKYESETEKFVYDVIYNDKDEIVRYSVKDENGTEIKAEEHVYDENGNTLAINFISNGEITGSETYSYDENGNLVSKRFGAEDDYFSIIEFTYDANGNPTKRHETLSYGLEVTTEMTFKLVYVPYEYTAEDWQYIIDTIMEW